jgi:hypothetical protein
LGVDAGGLLEGYRLRVGGDIWSASKQSGGCWTFDAAGSGELVCVRLLPDRSKCRQAATRLRFTAFHIIQDNSV